MAKEPLTTRLDADVKREVEDYADDHDIGQTEASRRLIRAGLAAEGRSVATTDGGGMGPFERLAAPRTVLVGAVLLTLALLPFAGAGQAAATGAGIAAFGLLGLSMILMGLGLTTFWAATLANLALARPLRALVFPSEVKA
jgi:hypothetical protein